MNRKTFSDIAESKKDSTVLFADILAKAFGFELSELFKIKLFNLKDK